MARLIKKFWLVAALWLAGTQSVFGFALLGPKLVDAYQDVTIGFFESPPASAFGDIGGGRDAGGPKNLGEGYRWNVGTLTYAYDASFLDYFGSNGVVEVDKVFAMMNGLTNVSSYSPSLSEWPLNPRRFNYRAQALSLLDLKSATMSLLIEQLGLAQPDRWTWALHDRYQPGPCPPAAYSIIQRNFDPVTFNYSSYVNGVLEDYYIEELCVLTPLNPFAPLLADAIEVTVDPFRTIDSFSAVAADELAVGVFFTSLSRDDIGGLRYLMATNRINTEAAEINSTQVFTNTTQPQLLSTSNLALFVQQALTNDAPTLTTLYPGLFITQSSNYFSNVVTTNIFSYFTNFNYSPVGTPATLILFTNFSTNVGTFFIHTFANVVTNHFYTNGFVTVTTLTIGPALLAPAGSPPKTTSTTQTFFTNFINGDFYIIPPNALCGNGFQILYTQLVTNVITTNFFGTLVSTNAGATNLFTNSAGQTFVIEDITYFTNYTLVVYPIQCLGGSNNVALREGIEKINFVRQDFDSLLTGFWTPYTNFYSLTAITNGTPVTQTFQRITTAPDILFDAADLTAGPGGPPGYSPSVRTTPNYITGQALPGLAGPGTINPGIDFTFNKVGPLYINTGPFFILPSLAIATPQVSSVFQFQWGSFSGTTNDPIVYPDTTSLANLEAQVLFQITTGLLPNASVSVNNAGNPYAFHLGVAGGFPRYTWSLDPNSPALPPGFSLSANGVITGVPTTVGTFDFTVRVTDAGGRITEAPLFIQIGP